MWLQFLKFLRFLWKCLLEKGENVFYLKCFLLDTLCWSLITPPIKSTVIYSRNWNPDLAWVKSIMTLSGPSGEMNPASSFVHNLLAETCDNIWQLYVLLEKGLHLPLPIPSSSGQSCGIVDRKVLWASFHSHTKLLSSALHRPWTTFPTNMTGGRRQPPSVIMTISHKVFRA